MNQNKSKENAFFGWIREQQVTRTVENRWIGGVASGIAARFKIDPLIVRAIFVVLAILGGPGFLLYVLGWLFLPAPDGRIHLQEVFRGRGSFWAVVVTVILGIWAFFALLGPILIPLVAFPLWGITGLMGGIGLPYGVERVLTWIFWLAVIGFLVFLAHRAFLKFGDRNRVHADAGVGAPLRSDAQDSAKLGFSETVNDVADSAKNAAEQVRQWGEKTAASATEWSEKYVADNKRFSLSGGYVMITFALAILAAALTSLIYLNTLGEDPLWFSSGGSTALLLALMAATAVFSISMIVAGIRGKRSGFVGFLGFLGTLAIATVAIFSPSSSGFYLVGDVKLDAVHESGAVVVAGQAELDLRGFNSDFSVSEYSADFGAVDVHVFAPEERPTIITVFVMGGLVQEGFNGEMSAGTDGIMVRKTIVVNPDSEGKPLKVKIRVLAGAVTIDGKSLANISMEEN